MSRYEAVYKSICRDPDFRALSVDAKWLYLWSFINEACHLSGLYEMTAEQMAFDSTLSGRRLTKPLKELHEARLTHFHDNVIWVRSKIKRLATKGSKIAQPIFREVCEIDPRHPLRIALIDYYTRELPGRGEDYEWLRPLLQTLNVVPHSVTDKIPEYDSSDESSEGRDRSIELVVLPSSEDKETLEEKDQLLAEFEDWLQHHRAVTGDMPPAAQTKARAKIRQMFLARRREDYSLDDLKSATVGAFNDDFRYQNGHFGCVSVLRPEKVYDLIQKGRRGRPLSKRERRMADLDAVARRFLAEEEGDGPDAA